MDVPQFTSTHCDCTLAGEGGDTSDDSDDSDDDSGKVSASKSETTYLRIEAGGVVKVAGTLNLGMPQPKKEGEIS